VGGGAHCCCCHVLCILLLYCWLGLFVYCVYLVLSLYCKCSLQGICCTINLSYITYFLSPIVSVLCYLRYMRVLACSFCVVVSSALLYIATVSQILPCWGKVSGGPELGWVIVLLSAGRGIGRDWVVRLILWLLEFFCFCFMLFLFDSLFLCVFANKALCRDLYTTCARRLIVRS